MTSTVQLELFAPPPKTGPRGFPLCSVCGTSESIGPVKPRRPDLCVGCWSPERDPEGWASWFRILAGEPRRG